MPPRPMERLLRLLVKDEPSRMAIVGDLREEYAAVRQRAGRVAASAWYSAQAILIGSRIAAGDLIHEWRDGEMMGSALQDLRFGARGLLKAPFFTLVSVVTLAIGVGATTAIYSVVHGVLLAPLPFADPERVVEIGNNTGGTGWYGSSPAQFLDYEEQLETLSSVGGYVSGLRTVGDSLRPRRVAAAFLTHGTWETLGVEPIRGRVFTAEEDVPGVAAVVVLSEAFWRQEYGSDPDIVGRTVRSNGVAAEVVGVMPAEFAFPDTRTAMWFPFQLDRETATRGNHFVRVVGRLRGDHSLDEARAEVAALAARAVETYPENYSERGYRTRLIPLQEAIVGDIEVAVLITFGAVLLVLLTAAVNVANLVLARSESRRREVAVRSAMGAGRVRVARQLLTESALLGGAGGVLGIAIARVGVWGIVATAPEGAPRFENVTLSAPVLGFALLVVAVTVLFFGLWPAVRATGGNLRGVLSEGGRSAVARSGQAVRRTLVVFQVGLAAILAVGAGVMIRSLDNLYSEDLGFWGEGVATFRVDLPGAKYRARTDRIAFYERFTEALADQPGIREAAASARLPLFNTYSQLSLHVDGKPVRELGAADDAYIQISTPQFFDVMGIRPSHGRLYGEADVAGAPLVTVVNETMARELLGGRPPLGQRVRMWSEDYPYVEVVGVVPDVKEERIQEQSVPRMYLPYAQSVESTYLTPGGLYVALLTVGGNPLDAVAVARRVLGEIDPTVPISRVRTMESIVAESLATERFARALLEMFGIIAVLLACVGVYGVLSVAVSQRASEIGLRKALGATSGEVLGSVMAESALLAGVGGSVGIAAAAFVTRAMESLLYGVSPTDPVTLISVLGVMAACALVAAALPAIRASRVDPMVALKGD